MDDRRQEDRWTPDSDPALSELRQALRDAAAEEAVGTAGVDRADLADADAELLGLLAYGLEERPPAPQVKDRLMAAVRSGADATEVAVAETEVADAAPSVPASLAERRRSRAAEGEAVAGRSSLYAAPWLPALAAALLLAVLGLSFFAGKQYGELGEQRRTIAELNQRLERADEAVADLAASRVDLASRLSLVATPGVEVCPLRPQGASPLYPEARGLLFLSGPREEWLVRVAALEPAPPGQTYRLWFVFGDEAREAGVLLPGDDDAVVLSGRAISDSREMTAALVTLESADLTADRPSGPTVLYGDEKMDMI